MTLGPKLSVLNVIVTQRFLFVPRQPGTPAGPVTCPQGLHFLPLSSGAVVRMGCFLWAAGVNQAERLSEAGQHMTPASFMCGQSSGQPLRRFPLAGTRSRKMTVAQGTMLPLVEPPRLPVPLSGASPE